ncbi:tRNA pseudouridine(38-40) synthase TruA [Mitsuokella sp.]|uniref:tRNA pseudouridine(38-40) synthase TruA n=1 Tax=Mitsuokella sp. TaxID=2049034 RepID=UPI003D7C8D41
MKREHKAEMKARARNVVLKVAYDGTAYHGFQRQTPPVVAVQNILEEKLAVVFGDSIELAAAGRTDAGVHAYGQVVNFFTNGRIPTDRIVRAVNSLLPSDIAIQAAGEADFDFSARHSAKSKTYIYRLQQGGVPNPMTARYAWYIRRPLDLTAMREALNMILGTHDFTSFRASGGAPMSPVRTMYDVSLTEIAGGQLECRIHGSGFLYHMVRNIIGTLANVGLGYITPEGFKEILEAKDRQKASATAPACGLFLAEVDYGESFHF